MERVSFLQWNGPWEGNDNAMEGPKSKSIQAKQIRVGEFFKKGHNFAWVGKLNLG